MELATRASDMEKLPLELKKRLTSYLATKDLLNFSKTCKSVDEDFNLFVSSSPLTTEAQFYRSKSPECFAVVIPNQKSTAHSMTFTCNAEECGSIEGTISILEHDLPSEESIQNPENIRPKKKRRITINHGKEAASSRTRTAHLENCKISLSFNVRPKKMYRIYVSTPGFIEYDMLRLSEMTLWRVGFSQKSTDYKTKLWSVWDGDYRNREGRVVPAMDPLEAYSLYQVEKELVLL